MATNNLTILENIWLNGTNDYQQRIPQPTQNGISQVMDALFDPMNRMYFNQFIDALIMRIGSTYVHQQSFRNPLRDFKKPQMLYGSTIQEIIPKWIRAHSYIDDAEDVFKMARPDVRAWYHSQNRRDRYDITVNDIELRTAFDSENGINQLIAAIMNVPMNSDEYDEYRIMMQLIALYDEKWGFFKHALSARPTSEATGKEFLTAVRTYAGKLRFPSTTYNNGALPDIPIFVNPSELVLFVTPETDANIDVNTLAVLFNLDKADIPYRKVLVDEFPISDNGCVALLTTTDFFMCKDTEYRNTSMYNPKTLGTNYFLHHWGVYSVSPFVPAIMFKVGGDTTSVTVVEQSVTGITITPNAKNVSAGTIEKLVTALTGSLDPDKPYLYVAPSACTFDTTVTRTVTGRAGVYKVAIGGTWAASDTITIHGTTVTLDATSAASTSAAATAVRTALGSDAVYTVGGSGANVTLTEKSGFYGVGSPSVSKTSTNGTVTKTTTTEPISTTSVVNEPKCRVDEYGNLHVPETLESGDQIKVVATSTYVNPSGSTTEYSAEGYYTVS